MEGGRTWRGWGGGGAGSRCRCWVEVAADSMFWGPLAERRKSLAVWCNTSRYLLLGWLGDKPGRPSRKYQFSCGDRHGYYDEGFGPHLGFWLSVVLSFGAAGG